MIYSDLDQGMSQLLGFISEINYDHSLKKATAPKYILLFQSHLKRDLSSSRMDTLTCLSVDVYSKRIDFASSGVDTFLEDTFLEGDVQLSCSAQFTMEHFETS